MVSTLQVNFQRFAKPLHKIPLAQHEEHHKANRCTGGVSSGGEFSSR